MRVWLFDIDGTLIVSSGAGQAATYEAARTVFGIEMTPGNIGFAGRTDRAIAADVFRANRIGQDEASWHRFRTAYLEHLRETLHQRPGAVLAGVRDLLGRLQTDQHAHLGLLTGNIQAGAEAKLKHYQLWDYFGFGGYGDHSTSRAVVAAAALSSAEQHLGRPVKGTDVWVVGDTVHDISCARSIGANVIAVATGGTSYDELAEAKPDRLLRDLTSIEVIADLVPA